MSQRSRAQIYRNFSTRANICYPAPQDHSSAPNEDDPALGHIHFSQLYLVALYTYDAQIFHADIRVVYPYTPVEGKKTPAAQAATGTPAH